ncbi:MAG: hypothetical protein H6581_21870 [Bacteroidia bacterium]|nr:hypothetical protein [Bacteroidia bacterium]
MRKIAQFLLLLILPAIGMGQLDLEVSPKLTNGFALGVFAHTFGVGGNLNFYQFRERNDFVFSVAFSSVRSKKEQKTASLYKDYGGKDYRPFKKNYFYTLVPSFGLSRVILKNSPHNRIGIRGTASAGPIIGLLQPYYLRIGTQIPGSTSVQLDDEPFDATRHDANNIIGLGDPFLGIDEMKVQMGLQLRASAILNFSNNSEVIHGIEAGVNADIYARPVPIMEGGGIKNNQVFLSASIGVLFGSAW